MTHLPHLNLGPSRGRGCLDPRPRRRWQTAVPSNAGSGTPRAGPGSAFSSLECGVVLGHLVCLGLCPRVTQLLRGKPGFRRPLARECPFNFSLAADRQSPTCPRCQQSLAQPGSADSVCCGRWPDVTCHDNRSPLCRPCFLGTWPRRSGPGSPAAPHGRSTSTCWARAAILSRVPRDRLAAFTSAPWSLPTGGQTFGVWAGSGQAWGLPQP